MASTGGFGANSSHRWPLVGRDDELATLDAALDRVASGGLGPGGRVTPADPWLLEIVGEPGIGKTRLLAELCQRAAARDHLVLAGRATEFEREVPFGSVVEAIDDYLAVLAPGSLARLGPARRELLAAVFPALGHHASGVGVRMLENERYRLHRAVRMLLEELAEPAGLVLALDDLHWADDGSVELILHLLRHPPRAPVLMVVSYRPAQVSARVTAALADEERVGRAGRIALGPLALDGVTELLGREAGRSRCARLHQASGGNPLYLEALVRADQTAPPNLTGGGLQRAEAALRREFDGLAPTRQLVAQAAAVAGDPFEPDLVARTAGLDLADTLEALDELLERDLIRPADTEWRFQFRHPLLRRVAYDGAGESWRLLAHARIAAALEQLGAPVVVRAHHVARSAAVGDEQAISLLLEAAEATSPTAPSTAAAWRQTAARLLPAGTPAARRLEILRKTAYALGVAGQLREGRDILHAVLRELPKQPAEPWAEAVTFCATLHRLLGNHAEARRLLLAELREVATLDSVQAADLKLEAAFGSLMSGQFDTDRKLVVEALETARRHGDRGLETAACGLLAFASFMAGAITEATDWCDAAAALCDGLSDAELTARLHAAVWMCWSELCLERYADALRHSERGLSLARASGQNHVVTYLLMGRSATHRLLGRVEEADEIAEDAVDAALLSSSDELLVIALALRCWYSTITGDLDTAIRCGEQAVGFAGPESGWWRPLAELYLAAARYDAGSGDLADDFRRLSGGSEAPPFDPLVLPTFYEHLTRYELGRGRIDAAAGWARRTEAAGHPDLRWHAGLAQLAHAQVLLAQGRAADAAGRARAAVTSFGRRRRTGPNNLEAGRAHLVLGQALDALGDQGAALEQLDSAEALLAASGGRRWHAETLREQRRLGRRMPRADEAGSAGVDRLTPREREITELLAQGFSNREIAERLVVSNRTVTTHASRIYAKVGVSSRTALAAELVRTQPGRRPEDT